MARCLFVATLGLMPLNIVIAERDRDSRLPDNGLSSDRSSVVVDEASSIAGGRITNA